MGTPCQGAVRGPVSQMVIGQALHQNVVVSIALRACVEYKALLWFFDRHCIPVRGYVHYCKKVIIQHGRGRLLHSML